MDLPLSNNYLKIWMSMIYCWDSSREMYNHHNYHCCWLCKHFLMLDIWFHHDKIIWNSIHLSGKQQSSSYRTEFIFSNIPGVRRKYFRPGTVYSPLLTKVNMVKTVKINSFQTKNNTVVFLLTGNVFPIFSLKYLPIHPHIEPIKAWYLWPS